MDEHNNDNGGLPEGNPLDTAIGAAETAKGIKDAVDVANAVKTGATVASMSNPLTAIPTLALKFANKLKNETLDVVDDGSDSDSSSSAWVFVLPTILVFLAILIVVGLITSPMIALVNIFTKPINDLKENINEIVQEVETHMLERDKEEFFEKLFGRDYEDYVNNPRQFNDESLDICKEIIDYSIYRAFDYYSWNLMVDLENWRQFLFKGYNPRATYDKILKSEYPYALPKEDGTFYTVEEYLANPTIKNNDLNYAEIFSVLCQNNLLDYENFTYEEFFDLLVNKKTTELLFELEIGDRPLYYAYEENESADALSNINRGIKSLSTPSLNTTEGRTVLASTEYEEMELLASSIEDESKQEEETEKKVTIGEKVSDTIENIKSFGSSIKEKSIKSIQLLVTGLGVAYQKPSSWFDSEIDNVKKDLEQGGDLLDLIKLYGISKIEEAKDMLDQWVAYAPVWVQNYFFIYDVTVRPYGLEEMYAIAGTTPEAMNSVHSTMRNIDILNNQEEWLRAIFPDYDFGTGCNEARNQHSLVYNELQEMIATSRKEVAGYQTLMPTGRSALRYVDRSLVNMEVNGSNYVQEWNENGSVFVNYNYNPNGETVILNMFEYINQGTYETDKRGKWNGVGVDTRDTIKKSGCIDCCYVMIYEYFFHKKLSVPAICRDYVNQDNLFMGDVFVANFGMRRSEQTPFDIASIVAQITAGKPVMLHISGYWNYGGITYHDTTNGHFLVIMGYDDDGFYFYDPGSKDNTFNKGAIPYDAFNYVSGLYSTYFEPRQPNYSVYYKENTIGKTEE